MKYKIPHLAMRMVRERTLTVETTHVMHSADAAKVAHKLIGKLPTEHVIAILLNGQNQITGITTVAQGGMTGAAVSPRDILRAVLAGHAAGFILAHNHPSGDPTPSDADRLMTASLRAAAEVVGCTLLDHIVVTANPLAFRSV